MTAASQRRRGARSARMRGALAALAACASPALFGEAPAAAPGALASELRACARAVRAERGADLFGLVRIDPERDCPSLWARSAAGGAALGGRDGLFPAGATTLRQLDDLARLADGAADGPASTRMLPAARLEGILDALDPAARGELSTRARLARWWRSVVGEFDPRERRKRDGRSRAGWPLGFWSTVSWFAFGAAALLVVSVVIQEVRAALGPRVAARRRPSRAAAGRQDALDAAALAALPPRQRAGELLRLVAARLHSRGALPPPAALTPREIGGIARLPQGEAGALAAVTAVGEGGAYARRPPDDAEFAAAATAAVRWLGARRRWRTPGGRA